MRPVRPVLPRGVLATALALLVVVGLTAVSVSGSASPDAAPAAPTPADGSVMGAAALTVDRPTDWSEVRSVDRIRPTPAQARDDSPVFYDSEPACQVGPSVDRARICEWGDTTSDRVIVIVGDSKVSQWQPALDAIGKDEGWKLVQVTKSGCAFTDAMRVNRGRAWTECRSWGRSALSTVIDLEPDLVLTSQRAPTAVPDEWPDSGDQSSDLMVDGLVRFWSRIRDAGIPVAALLDNPSPPTRSVSECVAAHPDDLRVCSFDRNQGFARSGSVAMLNAVQRLPETGVLDMTDVVCPTSGRCPAVIGDVLVYRDGSHLSRTFVESARPQLAERLATLTDGAFGRG